MHGIRYRIIANIAVESASQPSLCPLTMRCSSDSDDSLLSLAAWQPWLSSTPISPVKSSREHQVIDPAEEAIITPKARRASNSASRGQADSKVISKVTGKSRKLDDCEVDKQRTKTSITSKMDKPSSSSEPVSTTPTIKNVVARGRENSEVPESALSKLGNLNKVDKCCLSSEANAVSGRKTSLDETQWLDSVPVHAATSHNDLAAILFPSVTQSHDKAPLKPCHLLGLTMPRARTRQRFKFILSHPVHVA